MNSPETNTPQGYITAEASALAIRQNVENVRALHRVEMAAIRRQVIDLEGDLRMAESLSAAKLGVQPIAFHGNPNGTTGGTILARYQKMSGAERTAFYAAHSEEIWAASETAKTSQ